MFVGVESSGFQAPYVPGRFRQRRVDPIQKIDPPDRVDRDSSYSLPQSSHYGTSVDLRSYEANESMKQAGRSVMVAQDVMSSPGISLSSGATFHEAQDLFHQRRFRHVPVTNAQGRVLGIVSDRDMWRGKAAPSDCQLPSSFNPARTFIHHVLSHQVLVAQPLTEVRSISRVMFEEHIGAMPIVSEDGRLMGIMMRSNIPRVLISHPGFDQWVS